jgi:hypothetical protein
MVKCPFCHFDNEDGALFCEQCKSDLGVVDAALSSPPQAILPEIVEAVPLVAIPEGTPVVEALLTEPVTPTPPFLVDAIPLETSVPSSLGTDLPGLQPVMTPPSVQVHDTLAEPPATPLTPILPETPIGPPSAGKPGDTAPLGPIPASAPTAPLASAPTATPIPAPAPPGVLSPEAQPRLLVLRGLKRNVEYPIYEGHNFIGRADEKPVDIDLDDQEPPDRVWSSRQHALVTFENGKIVIEDLNSSNGTFVNRTRIYPGQKRDLAVNDVIQIGTVQMKLIV